MSTPDLSALPPDLTTCPQWVLWANENGRKIPYRATGGRASTTRPADWATFEAARERFSPSAHSGLGFVFTGADNFFGVDLDNCRDPESGKIARWAWDVIQDLGTYAEVSPSLTGVKCFCRGKPPATGKRDAPDGGQIEVYSQGRYFTVTGLDVLAVLGEASQVADCQEASERICGRYFKTADSEGVTQWSVIEDCRRAVAELPEAVSGERGHDKAFRAACTILRYGVDGPEGYEILQDYNREQCIPEWTAAELTHKWRDAQKHVLRGNEFGVVAKRRGGGFSLDLTPLRDFLQLDLRQEFLVKDAVVEGQHLIIGGPKKTLKTSIALDLSIAIATGAPFLGRFEVLNQRPVVMISGESGGPTLQNTCSRICDTMKVTPDRDRHYISTQIPQFCLPLHLAEIQREIERLGIGFCVVDPTYLCASPGPGGDVRNMFDMGDVLRGFGDVGVATGCTMAIVHHARKAGTGKQLYQPLDLDDLSFSGFAEWARQWILLSKREEMLHGYHRLWMVAGGSAGHGDTFGVDVDEGKPADPLAGRIWRPAVSEREALESQEWETKKRERDHQEGEDDQASLAWLAGFRAEKQRFPSTKEFLENPLFRGSKRGRACLDRLEENGQILRVQDLQTKRITLPEGGM